MELFLEGKPFYRGNLHCHTTMSDGVKTPEEVIATYQAMGYDFLAITDHRQVTITRNRMEGNMLLLPGIEMDYTLAGEVVHLVGFAMADDAPLQIHYDQGPQAGIDSVRQCGGRVIVAHPHWSLNTMSTLKALHGTIAAEIYNSVSYLRPDSSDVLDVTATHGKLYPLVASDDSHQYEGEAGVSYTMVQASELSIPGILNAMDKGLFFASQGPQFSQISLAEGKIIVRCSPVHKVFFHSNLPWTPGRMVVGNGLQQASYQLHQEMGERFIRCQIIDEHGKSAWCSPIAL